MKTVSLTIYTLLLCLAGLLLAGCSDDAPSLPNDGGKEGTVAPHEMTLRFTIGGGEGRGTRYEGRDVTSTSSSSRTSSLVPRASEPSPENEVKDLLIMLFTEASEGSNTPGKLWKVVKAENLSGDLGDGRYTFDIKVGVDPVISPKKVVAVALANGADYYAAVKAGVLSESPTCAANWSFDEVQRAVGSVRKSSFIPCTFWGVADHTLATDLQVQTVHLNLTRDMAMVSVNLSEEVQTANHRLAYAFIYNHTEEYYLIPLSNSLSDDFQTILNPSIPAAASVVEDQTEGLTNYTPMAFSADYSPYEFYSSEQKVVGKERNERPAIIVGLYYAGKGDRIYWYRVDIKKDDELTDLLRNYKYILNINGVNGPGEDTPTGAYNSTTTHVTADIAAWLPIGQDIEMDGGNWIASANAVELDAEAGATATITVRSNVLPTLWSAAWGTVEDNFDDLTLSDLATVNPLVGDPFMVTFDNEGEETVITFTALKALPADSEPVTRILYISVTPRLRFMVTVTQRRNTSSSDDLVTPWGDSNIYDEI